MEGIPVRVVTVVFDYEGVNHYERLLRVFVGSLKEYAGLDAKVIRLKAPDKGRDRSFSSNTAKLDAWVRFLKGCEDGEKVVFMDCDMLIQRPFDDAFDNDFDIGYTYRAKGIPMNGGVVFVRNNAHSRAFIKEWGKVNRRMLSDPEFHRPWHEKYAGINQASFGYLLENEPDADILPLPCSIYNACDDTWRDLSPDVRAIHYKSGLRLSAIGLRPTPEFEKLTILWREHENRYIDMYHDNAYIAP